MARGSSWMKAKRAKMATPLYRAMIQASAWTDSGKECFARHETLGAANAARTQTDALVAAYLAQGGKIKREACTGKSPSQHKKATVCLGDTAPGRASIRYGKPWNC